MTFTTSNGMKIGIFDSGLGGLFLMKPVVDALPQYDYLYLGDTANLPYGDKTQAEIYALTKKALDYLFAHSCAIVFIFCNTASARALRKLQHEGYRALGIIIPTVEEIRGLRIGILATDSTVKSKKYLAEIKKISPNARVFQLAAPKLVPMIEAGKIDEKVIEKYVIEISKNDIDTLILGCTHYGMIKKQIKKFLSASVRLICQEEIIAPKVTDYLLRHPEIETKLSKRGTREYFITAHHPRFKRFRYSNGSSFRLVIL